MVKLEGIARWSRWQGPWLLTEDTQADSGLVACPSLFYYVVQFSGRFKAGAPKARVELVSHGCTGFSPRGVQKTHSA